ncbi:MAG: ABC transporter ATP-binding protein [Bacilli bacterium]|nr:ABC transporter ATP-binding protein [Bacilli bacterium]
MIKIDNLVKRYSDFELSCSLEVLDGRITGLIGENGSGKTTLFKLILNLIKKDSGTITIMNKDISSFTNADKEKIGVSLSNSTFSGYLSVKDIIEILNNFYNEFDKDDFIENLKKFKIPLNKKVKDFSTGMKAKLKMLIALSHNAKLLILDEPTSGLDIVSRNEILSMLQDYLEKDKERSILISSHISNDLESLCDDIYMIEKGKIILHEDNDVLLNDYGILKLEKEMFENIDKSHILKYEKNNYCIMCLTDSKQYYRDNYPKIIIENTNLDSIISLMIKGENV